MTELYTFECHFVVHLIYIPAKTAYIIGSRNQAHCPKYTILIFRKGFVILPGTEVAK